MARRSHGAQRDSKRVASKAYQPSRQALFEALENRTLMSAYVPTLDAPTHLKLSDATSYFEQVPAGEGSGTPVARGVLPSLGMQSFTAFRITDIREGDDAFTPANLGTRLMGLVSFLEFKSNFMPFDSSSPSAGGTIQLGDSTRPHTTAPDPTGLGRATLGRFFLFDNPTGSEFFNTAGNQADDVLFNDNQFGYQIDSLSGVVGGTLLATGSLIDNDANPFDGQITQFFFGSALGRGVGMQATLGGELVFDGGAWADAGFTSGAFSMQLYTIKPDATAAGIHGGLIRPDVFDGGWYASSEDPITLRPPNFTAGIDIEKYTNGEDADLPTGPFIPAGGTATWTYVVTNTGNTQLANVSVTDDNSTPGNAADDFAPTFVGGDTDGDGKLDPTETWTYTASAPAIAGQYGNDSVVVGTPVNPGGTPVLPDVTDSDPSHYFGTAPDIELVKLTNGTDNNSPTGPVVPVGSTVTWTYVVTNPGNVGLSNVTLVDDAGTPLNVADDFAPTFVGGDTDGDGLLDTDETWTYTAAGVAVAGQYENYATVSGKDIGNDVTVDDTDLDHYFAGTPGIDLVKLTNGTDNNSPTGPVVPVGSTVTWTYIVTNTGDFPLGNVSVVDDNGTPGNAADDFAATFVGGDTNGDALLDLTETWTYTASGIAVAGQYENYATVSGKDPFDAPVSDTDLDHYIAYSAGIDIEKYVKEVCEPVTGGGEGFTPGYWKQWHHFDDWTGYTPWQKFNTVFGVNYPGDPTLYEALTNGGGGHEALGRHAVAALLNASHANVAYLYSTQEVISMVQGAFASGQHEATKDLLVTQNELGGDMSSGGKGATGNVCDCVTVPGYGDDADLPTGPIVEVGGKVEFTFVVTNTGGVELENVVVTDNNATPENPADDFSPTFVGGDTDGDGRLDVNETWTYTSVATVTAGQHTNTAVVTGTPVVGGSVTDNDPANYFGKVKADGKLSGYVWKECDDDGVLDSGELRLAGVTVKLYEAGPNGTLGDGDDVLVDTEQTNSNGYYEFSNLSPGEYRIEEVQPVQYLDGKDNLGSLGGVKYNDLFTDIVLGGGEHGQNYNFAEIGAASIEGTVYYEKKVNNCYSERVGIEGVVIKLTGTDDRGQAVSRETTTDACGDYKFEGLRPGNYTVTECQPTGYADGQDYRGTAGGTVYNDKITNICLSACERAKCYNFSEKQLVCKPSSLSGYVFNDKDNDGKRESGESGIKNVKIILTGRDVYGNDVYETAWTDSNGCYKFDDLAAGTYTITECQPSGWDDGKDTAGNLGGLVSNDKISCVTLKCDESGKEFNFGEREKKKSWC